MTEQKIIVPDGFKLEKVSETEYKIIPNRKKLPETWEEFCAMHQVKRGESWINYDSGIVCHESEAERHNIFDKNLISSKEKAEAILALIQLIQLRDCYNDGWKPEWTTCKTKHCLALGPNGWYTCTSGTAEHIFAFKTENLRDEFRKNFKDLLEELKPLFQ